MARRKKEPKIQEPIFYIGPSIPDYGLSRNMCFKVGVPKHLLPLAEECPAIGHLFVPVSKLAAATKKLRDSSSVESARFNEARKFFSKGDR